MRQLQPLLQALCDLRKGIVGLVQEANGLQQQGVLPQWLGLLFSVHRPFEDRIETAQREAVDVQVHQQSAILQGTSQVAQPEQK